MSYTGYPKALEQYLIYNKQVFELKDGSGNDVDMNHILSIEVPVPPTEPVPVVFEIGDVIQLTGDHVRTDFRDDTFSITINGDENGTNFSSVKGYNENYDQHGNANAPVEAYFYPVASGDYWLFYSDGTYEIYYSNNLSSRGGVWVKL